MATPPTSPAACADLDDDESPLHIDEQDVEDEPLIWHHDHWDRITDYESPYLDWWNDWLVTHWHRDERSVSNESLYNNPTTQQWLQNLAELHKADFPTLQWPPGSFVSVKIPLFTNEDTGEEYQIALHLSQQNGLPGKLAHTSCPQDPVPWPESKGSKPLLQIVGYQASLPAGDGGTQQNLIQLPRFAIPLGTLGIRTNLRRLEHVSSNTGPPPTEWTDYQIVLDAESEVMPLWILCSRMTLRERYEAYSGRNPQLPIFNGLMQFQELGYDAACILDSVHRLGEQPSYQESCDLIRRTRAVMDPMTRDASLSKMNELTGGHV